MTYMALILAITLALAWIVTQRRAAEPLRFLVSVEPAQRPAGWGWIVLLCAVGAGVVAWVGWQ